MHCNRRYRLDRHFQRRGQTWLKEPDRRNAAMHSHTSVGNCNHMSAREKRQSAARQHMARPNVRFWCRWPAFSPPYSDLGRFRTQGAGGPPGEMHSRLGVPVKPRVAGNGPASHPPKCVRLHIDPHGAMPNGRFEPRNTMHLEVEGGSRTSQEGPKPSSKGLNHEEQMSYATTSPTMGGTF